MVQGDEIVGEKIGSWDTEGQGCKDGWCEKGVCEGNEGRDGWVGWERRTKRLEEKKECDDALCGRWFSQRSRKKK